MTTTIFQIYDKIFKKILTLSSGAVINLINGLFNENYPPDSAISYNWTEFEDKELKKILADTILTINGKYSYHLEAQMTKDEDIIFRVFEYGFGHASRNSIKKEGRYVLPFPEVRIIYLYAGKNLPKEYELELDFGSQGNFLYKAPTLKLQDISTEELNRKKMIILIPFLLLRLRETLKKERTQENLEVLKNLIQNDIIANINKNFFAGNVTADDARRLKRLTRKLYEHLYSHYEEMEKEGINDMTDESLMLDIDIIEKEHEAEIKRLLAMKDAELEIKTSELEAKTSELVSKDAEISMLKKMLQEKESALMK